MDDVVRERTDAGAWTPGPMPDARDRAAFNFFGALERRGRCFCPSTIRAVAGNVAYRETHASIETGSRVPPSDATAAALAYLAHMIELYGEGGGASGEPRPQYAVVGFDPHGFARRYGDGEGDDSGSSGNEPIVLAYGRADDARLVIPRASDAALPILTYVGDAPAGTPVTCAIDRLRFGHRLARFRGQPIPAGATVFLADAESREDRDKFANAAVAGAGKPATVAESESVAVVEPAPESSVPVPAPATK